MEESRVIIPVDVSEENPPVQPLVDLCQSVDVVILGYYPVPDRSSHHRSTPQDILN